MESVCKKRKGHLGQDQDLKIEPPKKKQKGKNSEAPTNSWEIYELVAAQENLNLGLSKTIVNLFEEEYTIPFLCRYRKDLINNLNPDKLRDIKETIEEAKIIQIKSQNILKTLEKEKLLTDEISRTIKSARSLEEIEHLSQLYKPAAKGSLYARAQKLGLEQPALNILQGNLKIVASTFVKSNTDGLKTIQEVEEGIKNIMSQLIAKNEVILEEVRNLKSKFCVRVSTSKMKKKKSEDFGKKDSKKTHKDSEKFENYYEFSQSADRIKPHQTLAINRGVSLKILSMKFEVDERIHQKLKTFVTKMYLNQGNYYEERTKLFIEAFNDAYKKKISPFIIRQVQSDLNKQAEKSAIDAFAVNLKNLLLTNPVRGRKILGIDPGYTSGCKLAIISETGELLETGHVIFVHERNKVESSEKAVSTLLEKYKCSLIAIGNATACRETEKFISSIIEKKHQSVQYCIVSEQGASIYSCSEIARKEFPKIDVSFLGAISIARRLLDPLSELVKIEPKHLGVGMYQHDVCEKNLKKTLDEIISECVSFVGVDLNCASVSLLKHVAGLTEKKAEEILKYRNKNGGFKSREELLKKVKLIGPKTFTQCAGFVRINAQTAKGEIDLMDSTNVHPESYEIAKEILKECRLRTEDVGKKTFVEKIQNYLQSKNLEKLADKYSSNAERLKAVFEALSQDSSHDYRNDVKIEPVFKSGIVDFASLKPNQIVSGVVMNILDFGAFVDLGVGKNGLIHSSAMKNAQLKVSQRVECKILNVDSSRGRIGLEFMKIL